MNQEFFLLFVKIGSVVFLAYPVGRFLWLYLKVFIYYMFDSSIPFWDRDVEKPRIIFFIMGILTLIISWMLSLNADSTYKMLISSFVFLVGTTMLYIMWMKKFEKKIIPMIRKRIVSDNLKSSYENGYDLKSILDQLIKLDCIDCTLDSFHSLLALKELAKDEKIKSFFKKRDLIRFIFVIFKINVDTKQKSIENIISYYFLDSEGKSYNNEGVSSDMSKIRNEILYNKKEYLIIHEKVAPVFEEFKLRK